MNDALPLYFIETLTLATWLGTVWPRLRRDGCLSAISPVRVFFIDAGACGLALTRAMVRGTPIQLERFDFDAAQLHDEAGKLIWLRIYYEDMAVARGYLERQPGLREYLDGSGSSQNLRTYLVKQVLPGALVSIKHGLWRALYLLHACLWKQRQESATGHPAVMFFDRRLWMQALVEYAARVGSGVIVPAATLPAARSILARLLGRDLLLIWGKFERLLRGEFTVLAAQSARVSGSPPGVALQYYGHFNLTRPQHYSDFFFWQLSELPGRNLVVFFDLPQDPLDAQRQAELAEHGIRGIARRYQATSLPATCISAPTALLRNSWAAVQILAGAMRRDEKWWLQSEALVFDALKTYWKRIFAEHNIKVFTTWFRYTGDHCAIAEALHETGGALAIYQRSYEGNATVQAALSADILFAFSSNAAQVEAAAQSQIGYCVTTGYLGDHRFAMVRQEAQQVRDVLLGNGAQYIATYFDESSFPDPRWGLGISRLRAHYAFLLERVLRHADFGLVLKPKTPRALRARLGPVGEVLDLAIATGRCHIFEDGVVQGAIAPAQAAWVADIAIHSSVASGTAGVEAALAGVPTVLMDDDGWTISPLYRLEKNRVIFDDWEALWHTWRDHRARPGGVPGFGAWSALLDELDPFRDGRAAERMGTYLKWLIEGFERGLPREAVLADAAERYCRAWGPDKVTSVRPAMATASRPY